MPRQELFFEQEIDGRRIQVLKTYDTTYAREVFAEMDAAAQSHLWDSLRIETNYEAKDIPYRGTPERAEFLWDELLDAAREDGNLLSVFVVNELTGSATRSLYVSPDWPSAESYARACLVTSR